MGGNGIWRQLAQKEAEDAPEPAPAPPKAAAEAEPAPQAEDAAAPAEKEKAEAPETPAELHPEWANSQQQIGWAQQRATNKENFADQAALYKSWKDGKATSDQWAAFEFEGDNSGLTKYGLAPPPLPFATASEKKAAAKEAAGAANAETPPAGDANSDGKLAKAEKDAQAAEGAARAEEAMKATAAKVNMDETEKTSVLEPMAYERRQNYNKLKEYAPRPTPEPFIMRTTFY